MDHFIECAPAPILRPQQLQSNHKVAIAMIALVDEIDYPLQSQCCGI